MLNIKQNVISLNRGDDAIFGVSITDETGEEYLMEAGDTLTFSVRALPEETSPVLLSVTSETDRILLRHADTAGIPAGKYSADIRLTRANGDILTVYPVLETHGRVKPWNNFLVDPEVT